MSNNVSLFFHKVFFIAAKTCLLDTSILAFGPSVIDNDNISSDTILVVFARWSIRANGVGVQNTCWKKQHSFSRLSVCGHVGICQEGTCMLTRVWAV